MPPLTYGFKSDIGRVRSKNQDSVAVVTRAELDGRADGLFVVADGMGGHAGGEIASRVAADTVTAVVGEVLEERGSVYGATSEVMTEALRQAIGAANEAVWKQARANPELRGMGTTCVAVLVRGAQAAVSNVGDSRAYLLRRGELRQITLDHSLVQERVRAGDLTPEEAQASRFRNVITRAVGIASEVEPDVQIVDLEEGDSLLLCSDGLTNMAAEEEIAELLGGAADAQQACDELVQAANEGGGEDNISAIVVRYGTPVPTAPPAPLSRNGHAAPDTAEAALLAPSPPARRGVRPLAVAAVLIGGLLAGGAGGYLLRDRQPPTKPAINPPPKMQPGPQDFGTLTYAPMAPVIAKPVRGAPLTCDAVGNAYVVASQSGRLVRVSPDGKVSGDFPAPLAGAEQPGDAADRHWATDAQGYVYVSLRAARRIEKYAPQGTRVATIGEAELKAPEGVAVDGHGNVLVVDAGRLVVFRAAPPAPNNGGASARAETGDRRQETRESPAANPKSKIQNPKSGGPDASR